MRRVSRASQDPTLRDFLSDGPSAVAGLWIQHAFEVRHSKEECRALIEAYAAQGGDHGLTEDTIRKACGLLLRRSQLPLATDPGKHRMPWHPPPVSPDMLFAQAAAWPCAVPSSLALEVDSQRCGLCPTSLGVPP